MPYGSNNMKTAKEGSLDAWIPKNDWWSSGSVDYSFSMNWDGSKWITILNFTLWQDSRLKHCHTPNLRIFFRHMFWQLWVIYCHFNAKTLLFTFLWLEFRFKSFLEFYVYTHAQTARRTPGSGWCTRLIQTVFSFISPKFVSKCLTTKQLSRFFGWSVRTLAQYMLETIWSSIPVISRHLEKWLS